MSFNVGQLRELIKDLPDNLPVRIEFEHPYDNATASNPVSDTHVEREALYLQGL